MALAAFSLGDEISILSVSVELIQMQTPAEDPFDDFDDDDFDDEFDDDFEEDWEDDLTEDEEFPDTFGGEEQEKDGAKSPFKDDPNFDDA